jgi:hybrid cluster-associated redox disulfide protein
MARVGLEVRSVSDIMTECPATIAVFLSSGMGCVGCPIGRFHTLADAAMEHGLALGAVTHELEAVIERETVKAGREAVRRR